jgi:hypothetical protein
MECQHCGMETFTNHNHPTREMCIQELRQELDWLWSVVLHPEIEPIARRLRLMSDNID